MNDWRVFLFEELLSPQNLWVGMRTLLYIVTIMFVAQVAIRFLNLVVERTFGIGVKEDADKEKHRSTLKGISKSLINYTVNFVAILTVLAHIGVDTRQLLAGAGILGLAIGFGAQALVKDFISGFFLLYENQFTVGDYVEAGGVSGTVHEMGLRRTAIRDFGGQYHYVPNGSINTVTNYSRGEMRVLVEIDVAYEEDLEHVTQVLTEVCDAMAAEKDELVEGPRVLGVSALGQSGVTLLLWGRAIPGSQWALGRELRLKAKLALDREGIEIPYPRRVVVPAHLTSVDRQGRSVGQ